MMPRGVSEFLLTTPPAGVWRAVRFTTSDSGLSRPVAAPAPAPATITLPRMRTNARETVSFCKKSLKSIVTWPWALTDCAPALGHGFEASFLKPHRFGFATLILPGQTGCEKVLLLFVKQTRQKSFGLCGEHPDELLNGHGHSCALDDHESDDGNRQHSQVLFVEIHLEKTSEREARAGLESVEHAGRINPT